MIEAEPGIVREETSLRRACALAGASRALSQAVARHPGLLDGIAPDDSVPRLARAALTPIAADDLAGLIDMRDATVGFSDAIDRLAGDVLARARDSVVERHALAEDLPFAVIAMGKWGARELNYASDIDLVLVHDIADEDETASRAAALALAAAFVTTLSARAGDGSGLIVDADLRPEGSTGPLSRSLSSYAQYYDRWGESWELQALLRPGLWPATSTWASGSWPWWGK
jgi:glutamate-ammonia-ligase adenylyltransferase